MAYHIGNEEWIKRAKDKCESDNYTIKFIPSGKITSKSKFIFECGACKSEWSCSGSNFIYGKNCPCRCGKTLRTDEELIDNINSIIGVKFVSFKDKKDRHTMNDKIIVSCDFGHKWESLIINTIHKKSGCPHCYGNAKKNENDVVDSVNAIDCVRFISFDGEYRNSTSKINVECTVCGHNKSVYINQLLHRKKFCPKCAGNYRYTLDEYIEKINEMDCIEYIGTSSSYRNIKSKVKVKCSKCENEWESSIDNVLRGFGCPSCAKSGYDQTKKGYLYLLKSKCGMYMKIGISNNYQDRVKRLSVATPFEFFVECVAESENGSLISSEESRLHKEYCTAGFNGFDGATEWFLFDSSVIDEYKKLGA